MTSVITLLHYCCSPVWYGSARARASEKSHRIEARKLEIMIASGKKRGPFEKREIGLRGRTRGLFPTYSIHIYIYPCGPIPVRCAIPRERKACPARIPSRIRDKQKSFQPTDPARKRGCAISRRRYIAVCTADDSRYNKILTY